MDFMQMFVVGQEKEAHGKVWIILYAINAGNYLAVEKDAELPATVQLIHIEKDAE